jgi:hypothetical protein
MYISNKSKQHQHSGSSSNDKEEVKFLREVHEHKSQSSTFALHRKTGILIVPKIYGSNVNVFAALEQLNIDFASLRILNTKLFPSGALLLQLASKEEADYVRKAISKSEIIAVGSRKIRPCYVQLQDIPEESTESEIRYKILSKFGEAPTKVQFLPSDTNAAKMARVYVNFLLWKKMKAFPSLVIDGKEIKIDTLSVTVKRCSKCYLLGHDYGQKCFRPARPAPSPHEPCLDCSDYNRIIAKAGHVRTKFHNTSHSTDDENCPTKKYYIAKWERHQWAHDTVEVGGTREARREGDESGSTSQKASKMSGNDLHTLLVVPKFYGAPHDVIAEMRRSNIDLKSLKITLFPSGAALLVCKSEVEANHFREIIAKSETLMTKSKEPPFTRRVHIDNLPEECTKRDISREIRSKYDEIPGNIFFPIIRDGRVAAIEVTSSLLEKIDASPEIEIRGLQYKIDTAFRVVRCIRCQLLGHTSKKCRRTPRPPYSPREPCLDCCHHNKHFMKYEFNPLIRSVTHATDSDDICPTKRYYMERIQRHTQAWNPKSTEEESEYSSDESTDEYFS